MPIGFRIRGPNQTTTFTDLSEYFRAYEAELTMNAEEGSVGTSTIRAYDPSGTFEYVGHRQFRAYETTATGSNTVIYAGYTAEREWSRGDYERTGVGRVVDITLTDINTVFSRRIITGADANRPAETDVQRVQWWESSNEGSLVDDTRYLNTSGGVAMDACDYRGQTGADVLNDCAQASGKNWFLWYTEDTDEFSLWYDFASSTNHSSPLRLSNVLSDIDDTWTFAISADTKLRRDPSRVYSGIYLPFDGGVVYERDATTANTFALSGRDAVMPSYNVKSRTKATARAQRYLSDLNTEEDVITTTVILPAAKVNFLTAGMRVQVRAVHLPGYDSYTWLRVLNRTVKQISEEYYSVTVELSLGDSANTPSVPEGSTAYAILYQPDNNASPVGSVYPDVFFGSTGDSPASGYPTVPKVGLVDYALDTPNRAPGYPYIGISSSGTGTLTVDVHVTASHAVSGAVTTTCGLYKNGALVTSSVDSSTGGLRFIAYLFDFSTDVSVVPGDVLSVDVSSTWGSVTVPLGTGSLANHLEVSGTLA